SIIYGHVHRHQHGSTKGGNDEIGTWEKDEICRYDRCWRVPCIKEPMVVGVFDTCLETILRLDKRKE
ncbi:23694_t:CDS:1, partial [Gigaspora rosea]